MTYRILQPNVSIKPFRRFTKITNRYICELVGGADIVTSESGFRVPNIKLYDQFYVKYDVKANILKWNRTNKMWP